MTNYIFNIVTLLGGLTRKFDAETMTRVQELENKTDEYQDALGTYLVQLSGSNLSQEDNRTLNTLLYTVADIERIGDHAVAVSRAAREMEDKSINFSNQARAELEVLERAVADIMDRTIAAYAERFARYKAQYAFPEEN